MIYFPHHLVRKRNYDLFGVFFTNKAKVMIKKNINGLYFKGHLFVKTLLNRLLRKNLLVLGKTIHYKTGVIF